MADVHAIELKLQQKPDPTMPHKFKPRKHGSPDACDICGGTFWDPIHDVGSRRKAN